MGKSSGGSSRSSDCPVQPTSSRPRAPPARASSRRLGEQLPDDPAAARSVGHPDRELPLPGDRPRQQQVGDVGTDDQQEQHADGSQDGERLHQHALRAQLAGPHRHHGRVHPAVRVRVSRRQPLRDGADLGTRLLDRGARRQPDEGGGEVAAPAEVQRAVARAHLGRHGDRHPDVVDESDHAAAEPGRGDADDRQQMAVEADRRPDHSRVAVVPALPHSVADHGDREGARLVGPFLGQEGAAQDRLHPQDVEVVGGDELRPGALRVAVGADAERRDPADRHLSETLQPVPVVAVVEVRGGAARGVRLDESEPARVGDAGVGVQQHAVDPAEDGRADGDAETQREHRHEREPRVRGEDPEREARILPEVLQEAAEGQPDVSLGLHGSGLPLTWVRQRAERRSRLSPRAALARAHVSTRATSKRPATSIDASICRGNSLVSSDFRHGRRPVAFARDGPSVPRAGPRVPLVGRESASSICTNINDRARDGGSSASTMAVILPSMSRIQRRRRHRSSRNEALESDEHRTVRYRRSGKDGAMESQSGQSLGSRAEPWASASAPGPLDERNRGCWIGDPPWTRTMNLEIKSLLLYQLS